MCSFHELLCNVCELKKSQQMPAAKATWNITLHSSSMLSSRSSSTLNSRDLFDISKPSTIKGRWTLGEILSHIIEWMLIEAQFLHIEGNQNKFWKLMWLMQVYKQCRPSTTSQENCQQEERIWTTTLYYWSTMQPQSSIWLWSLSCSAAREAMDHGKGATCNMCPTISATSLSWSHPIFWLKMGLNVCGN